MWFDFSRLSLHYLTITELFCYGYFFLFLHTMATVDKKTENEKITTRDEVKKLVEVRNLPEFIDKFEANKTLPHKISALWKEVAERAGLKISGIKTKEKYNNLMKEYRKNIVISKKTGEGGIVWKYWDLMKRSVVTEHE